MRVSRKGQVTIPQRLRKKYRIGSGAEVEFIEEDGRIELRVMKRSEAPIRRFLGRADVHLSTEEILRLTNAN